MKRSFLLCLSAALAVSFASEAFAWGAVAGPRGGAAYRGPAGGAAYRAPVGGVYRPGYGGAAVATGVVVGAAAATAYRPPAYYAPPPVVVTPLCGYYPYPACY